MKMMRFKLYGTIVLIGLACLLITSFVSQKKSAENNPPKIIITSPQNGDQFLWNSTIRYNIKITDIEDGLSEYDEINAKEVLLEVYYLPDASKAKQYLAGKAKIVKENIGLTMLKKSDCFTCHASKNKLIGPSFELIAKRYLLNRNSLERLTKNVINGSAGIWGRAPMPAHKTMKTEEVKQMISWILANNSNPNLTFYPGTEGAFRVNEKPANENGKGVIVLTASYTDHGEKGTMQNKKYGQHSILLKPGNK
jgi:cytochrome c